MRIYHKAAKIAPNGDVSALCYQAARKIPVSETWTNRDEAVTCKQCLMILAENTTQHVDDTPDRPVGCGAGFLVAESIPTTSDETSRSTPFESGGGTFGGGGASASWSDSNSSSNPSDNNSGSSSSDSGGGD